MDLPDRYELLTRLVRLERELLFVRRNLTDRRIPISMPEGPFQAVRVRVGVGECAIPSVCIRQIVRYSSPLPIRLAPRAVKGVLSVKGELIVVVDLGQRLGCGATPLEPDAALLIASVHDSLVALIIEHVTDAIQLERSNLHVPTGAGEPGACVAAVGTHEGRLIQVLDLEQLIPAGELELLTLSVQSP